MRAALPGPRPLEVKMTSVSFLSSDFNGTLVHSHTMQEMIRWGFPHEPRRWEEAARAFALQTEGRLSMVETFRVAGEMSRGLPLRSALDYNLSCLRFVNGYDSLMSFLRRRALHLAIISTGYTVSMYCLRYATRTVPFSFACNRMLFAPGGRGEPLGEDRIEELVNRYILEPGVREDSTYDRILATGEIEVGIQDEGDKAALALKMAFELGIDPKAVAHMGDTMGDSMGILGVARAGGLGIAFNYNAALEEFLRTEGASEMALGRIVLVDAKSPQATLEHVIPYLS